jgi:allantoate deiminase
MSEQSLRRIAQSLARRLQQLGEIGQDGEGGWSRLGFSKAERQAHQLFAAWAEELDLVVSADGIGNSYASRGPQAGPALMVGSHLDSVPHGGNFDGAAGVVAAMEVAALLSGVPLRHRLTIVAFGNEEGARFAIPCIGSRMAVGDLTADDLHDARDSEGTTAWAAARAAGLEPGSVTPWAGGSVGCYLELHIEQGRVLEQIGRRLGVVDSIAGSTRFRVRLVGRADHSGATPMWLRRDALAGAAESVAFVEECARRTRTTVSTVGSLTVSPNSMTTVPGEVRFTVDVRDIDSSRQREVADQVLDHLHKLAARRQLELEVSLLSDSSPLVLHHCVRDNLTSVADRLGVSYRVMPSGAGHDAGHVSKVAPAGLVFVPCRAGVSHSPLEWADVRDIAVGVLVLKTAVENMDRALTQG